MDDDNAILRKAQKFPVYYPGEAVFTEGGVPSGQPSGAVGAQALITITINTRPHGFLGIRLRNVFPVPEFPLEPIAQSYFPTWRDLHGLDVDQDVRVELAQQNILMDRTDQALFVGGPGIGGSFVWHPFPCVYPFRGGNNVRIFVTRTTAYPLVVDGSEPPVEGIFPVCKAVLVGYSYVTGDIEEGGPPSSGFPVSKQ